MATLQELISQKEALEREIEQTKSRDRSEAIGKVRTLMSEYGLSMTDLGAKGATRNGTREPGAKTGAKVAAKYRNTATGDSWSGRGLQPKWLKAALAAGKKIEEFAV